MVWHRCPDHLFYQHQDGSRHWGLPPHRIRVQQSKVSYLIVKEGWLLLLTLCRYNLKDVIVGKIYFLLVRIKIKHMELAIIKRESTGTRKSSLAYARHCDGLCWILCSSQRVPREWDSHQVWDYGRCPCQRSFTCVHSSVLTCVRWIYPYSTFLGGFRPYTIHARRQQEVQCAILFEPCVGRRGGLCVCFWSGVLMQLFRIVGISSSKRLSSGVRAILANASAMPPKSSNTVSLT